MSRSAGRGMIALAVMLVLATAVLASGGSVKGAQEQTPAADAAGLPSGVAVASLQRAVLDVMPPAPAFLALARLTHQPGMRVAWPSTLGTRMFYVESGHLVVEVGAVDGVDGAASVAGTETDLAAGDSIVVPPDTPVVTRNDRSEPAVALRVVVDRSAPPPPVGALGEELQLQRLANGVAVNLAEAPATVELSRITLDTGSTSPLVAAPGPALVFVEVGTLTLVTPGTEVTIPVGYSANIQGGTASEARNGAFGPLVLLVVSVVPATEDGAATPTA